MTFKKLFYIIILLLFNNLHADNSQQNKATLVYKICKFIYWPEKIHSISSDDKFSICIFTKHKLGKEFKNLEYKKIKSHLIKVHAIKDSKNIHSQCSVIFIDNSQYKSMPSILNSLKKKHILTLSSIQDFAYQGGMIEFSKTNNRLQLIINIDRIQESELEVDSELLEISTLSHNSR
jgi:hypothetical protein